MENEFTFENPEYRKTYWHTCSHIMAQAVKRLWPEVQLAIGPAIDEGWYYDFDAPFTFTPEHLAKIEAEMKKVCKERLPIVRSEKPRAEAIAYMQEKNEPYKVELINDLPEDAVISFYTQGDFTDLCAGPHLDHTGRVKHNGFKLLNSCGAYWRGDSNRKMLQRIYGIAFQSKEELETYLQRIEEAKKRDHRRLGKELGLFMLTDYGPGFPFFLPKGMVLRNTLIDYWREVHKRYGYVEVSTPMILNRQLWEQSGHWDHYKNNMYTTVIDGEDYAIKPMNCPGGMLVYASEPHSYRDLPLRVGELGLVHRHELSGALHGMFRVRCFTQDDAHIFCTKDQVVDEVVAILELVDYIMGTFGFTYEAEISTRPDKSIGTDDMWEHATESLKEACARRGLAYDINEGDGAFYGPKIDIKVKDAIGRTWQCSTVQIDFNMPMRFGLTYRTEDNTEETPWMLHRAIFGSIERFLGILIEHYAGALPLWLAPVQVAVIPIADRHKEAAAEFAGELKAVGGRVEVMDQNEPMKVKIAKAQSQKIPYMIVMGDKEVEEKLVSVRERSEGDLGQWDRQKFIDVIRDAAI